METKSLFIFVVVCVYFICANEEIQPFQFRLGDETIHAVADFDADKNWMSHHIFKNSQGDAGTVARDHAAGMEVFKFDGTKMCYARPITTNVNSVWAFKSLLEIAKEREALRMNPRGKDKEFLECTAKRVSEKKLGKVGYLCKGLPIYEVKSKRTSLERLKKVKRAVVDAKKMVCILCSGGCWWSRRKRDVSDVDTCSYTRITSFSNCPPKKGTKKEGE